MHHPVHLSIVVPCYNEQASLPRLEHALSAALGQMNISWEVILVDDGSGDRTAQLIREISERDPRFVAVEFSRNFGKEAAMLAGLQESRGAAVAIMDADLQHPPELLGQLYEALQREGVDQAVAQRTRTGDAFLRTQLSRLYYKFINHLVDGVRLTDGVGDFRILSRAAVDALLSLPESKRFSKGLFEWIGFRTAVVPYENVLRKEGESGWSFRALLNYGIDGVLAFNTHPLRIMVGAGVACLGAGILHLVYLIIQWRIHGIEAPGFLTLTAIVTLFSGVQLLSIGVVGQYIGAIYQEVKRRPHFIVRRRSGGRPQAPDTDPAGP